MTKWTKNNWFLDPSVLLNNIYEEFWRSYKLETKDETLTDKKRARHHTHIPESIRPKQRVRGTASMYE